MKISGPDIVQRCRRLAEFTESSTGTTRTFLSHAMRGVHAVLTEWMQTLAMDVRVDAAGNLRGVYAAAHSKQAPRLLIGSHLDTVPDAGAFDGPLGVVMGIALVAALAGERLPFAVEVIGFSEEEGVRFGIPFIGSRALAGTLDSELLRATDQSGISVADAIRAFGLDPAELPSAVIGPESLAYLEFHIEQGPVLEHLHQPLAVVAAIAGQSRYAVHFTGSANHAGTTPMQLRRDALAAAAEWICLVEQEAKLSQGLVATVGAIHSEPRAGNVVPGLVTASLDVRHASDDVRERAVSMLLEQAAKIAERRAATFQADLLMVQPAVRMDEGLVSLAQMAVLKTGCDAPLMTSGAGHDAMIMAQKLSSVMIFLRSPGGVSHHPDESVLLEDVEQALVAGLEFVKSLAQRVS